MRVVNAIRHRGIVDVIIIRVDDLPQAVREEIGDDGAFALTQARARAASSLVDEASAELLREFRAPSTIAEAVVRYSQRVGADPEETLTDAYTTLRRCLVQGYLVVAGSEGAQRREICLAVGERVAGGAVVRCLHVLEDTELYQVALDDGNLAALKVLRPTRSTFAAGAFAREAAILRHLNGQVAPKLLATDEADGNKWLALEWCDGVLATTCSPGCSRTGGERRRWDRSRRPVRPGRGQAPQTARPRRAAGMHRPHVRPAPRPRRDAR